MTESGIEPYMSEEYCGECDATVEIISDRVGTCPECGAELMPCNSCAYSAMLDPRYDPNWSSRCGTDRCPFATGVEKYEPLPEVRS
jgi:hypothetical protein